MSPPLRLPLSCAALLLTACAGLPPAMPPLVLPAGAPLATAPPAGASAGSSDDAAGWPAREWWHGFDDATLDALIAQALATSPDVAAAEARFAAARAARDATTGGSGLQLGASGTAARQRLSDNGLFPPALLGFNWYNQFDLGLTASYSFDWWGRHRAEIAASLSAERAAQAERAAAGLALASSVAEVYYGWQSDSARVALAQQRVAGATRQLEIVTARASANIQNPDDVQRAQLNQLAARDHLHEGEASAQLRLITLAALVGCAPAQLPALAVRALPQLHAGLPANATIDLLARRPEIAAERWRIEAAASNLEAARAGFMPDISLRGLLGLSSLELGKLLEAGSAVPSATAAIHLPLFDGGTLRAGFRHSQASLDEAIAAYRGGILAAARELNTQLATRESLARQDALRGEQLAAAAAVQASATLRVTRGITDARAQLEASDQWLALREAQLLTQYARLSAELALIRALGGGYQMEPTT
jgi:multidrug efflux system outer membrane protein